MPEVSLSKRRPPDQRNETASLKQKYISNVNVNINLTDSSRGIGVFLVHSMFIVWTMSALISVHEWIQMYNVQGKRTGRLNSPFKKSELNHFLEELPRFASIYVDFTLALRTWELWEVHSKVEKSKWCTCQQTIVFASPGRPPPCSCWRRVDVVSWVPGAFPRELLLGSLRRSRSAFVRMIWASWVLIECDDPRGAVPVGWAWTRLSNKNVKTNRMYLK